MNQTPSTPGEALRLAREARGWTLADLAARVGTHQQNIWSRERGRVAISMADRAKFKRVFEKDIFENVRPVLPDASKYRTKGIPVINRAAAGVTTDYQPIVVAGGHVGEYHGALQYLDRDGLDDPYLFAVVVCGASMEPALYDGDYVILSPLHPGRPHVQIHAGQVGLVRVGPGGKHPGNALARFAGQSGGVMRFTKDNPKFKGFEVEVENVEQLAVAVQRRTARV